MKLSDRHVVVIGGTSGIGLAVAEGALAEGARVTVASSRRETVDAGLASLSGASGDVIDVKDDRSVQAFFERVGSLDHLVFTAGDWGGPRNNTLGAVDLDAAQALFSVRFWGALRAVKHASSRIAPDGSVTLTDGMIAHNPSPGSFVSTAMAGAIEHLTRALAVELKPVRVNAVCPGLILTDVWNSIPEEKRAERLARMTAHLPLARVGKPDEAAEAYLYLMRGGYTTGQVLLVDGGSSVA
ncbi:MAG: SDR family oxidoreductase [Pseudomonadales bacterium]|nr:SDR family oxidoreductase [Pseudomonadales bacterium]